MIDLSALPDDELRLMISRLMPAVPAPTYQDLAEFRAGWAAGKEAHKQGILPKVRTPQMLEARQVWAFEDGSWVVKDTACDHTRCCETHSFHTTPHRGCILR